MARKTVETEQIMEQDQKNTKLRLVRTLIVLIASYAI